MSVSDINKNTFIIRRIATDHLLEIANQHTSFEQFMLIRV